MSALLEVKDLHLSFKKDQTYIPTLSGVSFSVNAGEMLGIVGESGSGKSVTSLAIMRLLQKNTSLIGEDSRILYNGHSLTEMSDVEYRAMRGSEISMIFQDPMTSLNPVLTIGYQLIEMIREHTNHSKKAAYTLGVEMLEKVGIARAEQIMHEYPHRLSGGMRQRVMIAMAMSCNPKLLIADEPTTALDVTIQAQILELMKQLRDEYHTSIILITHDLGVVAEVCERVIVMYAGRVVEEAKVKDIFKNPKHPYTIGLINSIPSMTTHKSRLDAIPGTVPTPEEMPIGCRFAPRCSYAMAKCFSEQPPSFEVEMDHYSSCWLNESSQ